MFGLPVLRLPTVLLGIFEGGRRIEQQSTILYNAS